MMFLINSFLLGVGLAVDAFTVSVANGLSEPTMRKLKGLAIALAFAVFQGMMPMIGWAGVRFAEGKIAVLSKAAPYIGFALLIFIGVKMIVDSRKDDDTPEKAAKKLTVGTLLVQAVATSIDALSVGFTISEYYALKAFCAAVIIAAVTFAICIAGVFLGKKIGKRFLRIAPAAGGVILILIGIEILIKALLA